MNYKTGKWAAQILEKRNQDGMWGIFHTLSCPTNSKQITTEQAIRRLKVLGFTKDDEEIKTVINRMCQCITGEKKIDDYCEKKHDWVLFERLMLSAWVRLFDPNNKVALEVAKQWAFFAEKAFSSGQYNENDDISAFVFKMGRKPKSGFEMGFPMFYHVALLQGVLSPKTESLFLDYCMARPNGIYYIYDKPLNVLPEVFESKKTSFYLSAIEVLLGYEQAGKKLQFVAEWLNIHKDEGGMWDLGKDAKDGIYFPLSDSWRNESDRKSDCTKRINNILLKI